MKFDYIVDSHCHLDLIESKGENIEDIINNSLDNKVKVLQTISTNIDNIDNIINFANKGEFIYCSVGTHPCNVSDERTRSSQEIIDICDSNKKIIGIGETGLDYFHDDSIKLEQKNSFIEHIKASQKIKLPVIIHSRDADEDMEAILRKEKSNQDFPALLHCFSSSEKLAKAALDLGIYISISGIVTFKNAKELQNIVKNIPLEFLLVETDSPYLAPTPFRGKTNQPAFTKHVVEFIAELKNIEVEEVIHQTTKNFFDIFTKASPL